MRSRAESEAVVKPFGARAPFRILGTHEQMLNGQIYTGCKFPAFQEYSADLITETLKIGKETMALSPAFCQTASVKVNMLRSNILLRVSLQSNSQDHFEDAALAYGGAPITGHTHNGRLTGDDQARGCRLHIR